MAIQVKLYFLKFKTVVGLIITLEHQQFIEM